MSARELKKSLIFFVTVIITSIAYGNDGRASDPERLELLKIDSVYENAVHQFDLYAKEVYAELNEEDISYESFKQALTGYHNLVNRGELPRTEYLTLIDFTKPSNERRFFIIDMCKRKVIHKSLVSHGIKSGGLYPTNFSNEANSKKSSLGFYVTTTTYTGKYDLAMRLKGMEHSNSHANSRGIVMHGADYAGYDFLEKNGCFLGRSYGCPALPHDGFEQVVDWIKEGTCLYIYYPSRSYKRYSKYLNRRNYLQEFVEV